MSLETDFIVLNHRIDASGTMSACHETVRLVYFGLRKLGYRGVEIVDGLYWINPISAVKHSWLEYKQWILETDARQLAEKEGRGGYSLLTLSVLEKSLANGKYQTCEIAMNVDEKAIKKKAAQLFNNEFIKMLRG